MSGIECGHGGLNHQCNWCDLEAEVKQQAETLERLKAALTNVKNCPESDLAAYVKSVDGIACETLTKLEAGEL